MSASTGGGRIGRRGATQLGLLGPVLCWAIVYADIGTSVYYVPGILYRDVGTSAASFVLATSIVFVFLAEKYADISARYANGGGVVSVATDAFGPRVSIGNRDCVPRPGPGPGRELMETPEGSPAAGGSLDGHAVLLEWGGGARKLAAAEEATRASSPPLSRSAGDGRSPSAESIGNRDAFPVRVRVGSLWKLPRGAPPRAPRVRRGALPGSAAAGAGAARAINPEVQALDRVQMDAVPL